MEGAMMSVMQGDECNEECNGGCKPDQALSGALFRRTFRNRRSLVSSIGCLGCLGFHYAFLGGCDAVILGINFHLKRSSGDQKWLCQPLRTTCPSSPSI